jgi:hypothetical protein
VLVGSALTSVLDLIGLLAIAAGIFLLLGAGGWAFVAAGAFLLVGSFIATALSAGLPPAPRSEQ